MLPSVPGIRRALAAIATTVTAVAAGVLAAPAQAGQPCATSTLMPAYHQFLATTVGLTPQARSARFLAEYVARYSGFYLIGGIDRPDELARPALTYFSGGASMPGMRPFDPDRLDAFADAAMRMFPAAQGRFRAAFPEFQCRTDIVFGVSLGRFDGTAVQGERRTYLLFGLDVISRMQTAETLPVLFSHELFHLYHRQMMPAGAALDPVPVWWGMWAEGLATYASGVLNPDIPAEALFGYPPDLSARIAPDRRRLAAMLLAQIDATGDGYAPFFTANQSPPGLPPRAGYWFGTALVRRLATRYSLPELARLDPPTVRALVLADLRQEAGAR